MQNGMHRGHSSLSIVRTSAIGSTEAIGAATETVAKARRATVEKLAVFMLMVGILGWDFGSWE